MKPILFASTLGLALWLALAPAQAPAVETAIYGDSSRQDFAQGDRNAVYANADGYIVLGPERTVILEGVDYAWRAAAAPDGTVYAGEVPGGKVYKVSGGKSEVFFETGESGVFSLLVLPDGAVLAGTGARGKVFRIARDGKGEELATLDAEYCNALALAPNGAVFAATGGSSGRIYRIAGGQAELFYQSPSSHLVSLAAAPDGSVYAGSGDRGAIYHVAPDGKATVVFTASQRVIACLAIGPDLSVYAGTAAIGEEKPGAEEEAVKSILGELQSRQQETPSNPAPGAPPARRTFKATNALYRIKPTGEVQPTFSINGGLILAVLSEGGNVLAGTGGQAGIFSVNAEAHTVARIYEAKNEDVLDLAAYPGGGFAASFGMPGQVMLFSADLSRSGTFTSRVLEAKGLTHWGRFSWLGDVPTGTEMSFAVRSGNTPVADATWTDWASIDASSGSAETNAPPSRYFQYRAELATASPTATPVLREAHVAGIAINLAPGVSDISVSKAEGAPAQQPQPQGQAATQQGGQGQAAKPKELPAFSGAVVISWKADDPNGDAMKFSLAFRNWSMRKFIGLAEDLSDPRYTWDTTSAPDGDYYFRVTASDAPSNTPETALTGSREEGPFIIDNTPPVISTPRVSRTEKGWLVEVDVSDSSTAIMRAASSVDGGRWEAVLPADGIFDSRAEKVTVKVDKPGASMAVIRVFDRAGNSAAVIAALQ